jgi:CTP:molybdopterin cytidylyltransferase MocA
MVENDVDVVVLAGDRGPGDPLARAAGVDGKTLVPVAGIAMLTRVLTTLGRWPRLNRILLVVPAGHAYDQAIIAAGLDDQRLVQIQPQASPSLSVAKALSVAGSARPVLLTTADHPLLELAWLDEMLRQSDDADLLVGLVDWHAVKQQFPHNRRTRYRFRDRSICGTNLFVLASSKADVVVDFWRRIEQQRKRPWRIVSMLGWLSLTRYLVGRLAIKDAFAALSERLGTSIAPRMLDDPNSAVDVDSEADLALVEQIMAERGQAC